MPGLTLDKFDIGVYIQYARRTELVEQVRQQYSLREATSIPSSALIIDLYPKLSEIELLIGIATLQSPWACFFPPKRFPSMRRSPFSFHRMIPSFGEEEDEDEPNKESVLDEIECSTEEDKEEKEKLKNCFKQIQDINELMRFIGGRIGQFLQG